MRKRSKITFDAAVMLSEMTLVSAQGKYPVVPVVTNVKFCMGFARVSRQRVQVHPLAKFVAASTHAF